MARSVAVRMAQDAGRAYAIEVDSAGTHAARPSQDIDPRARAVLLRRQYDPGNKRSRPIGARDFERFDWIVAMDEVNLAVLRRLCPPEQQGKLHLLLAFAAVTGVTEVPDPYHGNLQGFERVLELCEWGVRGLLDRL
jgi:protein-tyrosine phosphatase